MQKNQAGQYVSFQLNLKNGDPATDVALGGSPQFTVNRDGAGQALGQGLSQHVGKGEWQYAPTQQETNGNHVAFQADHNLIVNQLINIYPSDLAAELAKVIKSGETSTWASSLGTKNDVTVTRN